VIDGGFALLRVLEGRDALGMSAEGVEALRLHGQPRRVPGSPIPTRCGQRERVLARIAMGERALPGEIELGVEIRRPPRVRDRPLRVLAPPELLDEAAADAQLVDAVPPAALEESVRGGERLVAPGPSPARRAPPGARPRRPRSAAAARPTRPRPGSRASAGGGRPRAVSACAVYDRRSAREPGKIGRARPLLEPPAA
jgi:hypothetical protein